MRWASSCVVWVWTGIGCESGYTRTTTSSTTAMVLQLMAGCGRFVTDNVTLSSGPARCRVTSNSGMN
jgi:hypothetical protein